MKMINKQKKNHIELNNKVTKRREDGFFDIEKDQEALEVYLEEIAEKQFNSMILLNVYTFS